MAGAAVTPIAAGARSLAALRIAVFSMWLYHLLRAPLADLAELSARAALPTGLLRLPSTSAWDTLLRPDFLLATQALSVIVVALALIGARPYRTIVVTAAVLLTLRESLIRSFSGYVNHQEVPLLLATWVVAAFPAADVWSWPLRNAVHRRAADYHTGLALLGGSLALGYAGVAAHRWTHHGYDMLMASDRFVMFYGTHHSLNEGTGTMARFLVAYPEVAWLAGWGLPVVSLLELVAPLAIAWPRLRLWWLAFAVLFHAAMGLTISVFFWETSVILAVVLLGLPRCDEIANDRRMVEVDERRDRRAAGADPGRPAVAGESGRDDVIDVEGAEVRRRRLLADFRGE